MKIKRKFLKKISIYAVLIFILLAVIVLLSMKIYHDLSKNRNTEEKVSYTYTGNIEDINGNTLSVFVFKEYLGNVLLDVDETTENIDEIRGNLNVGTQIRFETTTKLGNRIPPLVTAKKIVVSPERILFTGVVSLVRDEFLNVLIREADGTEDMYIVTVSSDTIFGESVIYDHFRLDDIITFETDGVVGFEELPHITAIKINRIERKE